METLDEKELQVAKRLLAEHEQKIKRTGSDKIRKSEKEKVAFLRKILKSEKDENKQA